jgi:hypothetical protein
MRPVSSRGRLSALPHEVVELADRNRLAEEIGRSKPGIAYGLGRSYGDECLNPGGTLWPFRRHRRAGCRPRPRARSRPATPVWL